MNSGIGSYLTNSTSTGVDNDSKEERTRRLVKDIRDLQQASHTPPPLSPDRPLGLLHGYAWFSFDAGTGCGIYHLRSTSTGGV